MTKSVDWASRVGRRLRLRDLHVLSTVAQSGGMAKAATQLRVSQPAVSKAVKDVESLLGVRLFDRGPQGVRPTIYGTALLKCSIAVFDELRQGISQIESLSNPATGEVRVGYPESLAGMVATIAERLTRQFPKIVVHLVPAFPAFMQLDGLHERSVDLLIGRVSASHVSNDIDVEPLYDDQLLVVTSALNLWARRRKVALAELANEPWILIPKGNVLSDLVSEAFRANGLAVPREGVTSVSIHMTNHLLTTGRYLAVMMSSALRQNAERWNLKALPINLRVKPPAVAILTLKNRTLGPAVHHFIEHARTVAQFMAR